MSKTKFEPTLIISTRQQTDADGKAIPAFDIIRIPVHSFEVDGGANRKIDLSMVTEGILFSEFEQARSYKKLIFYIPPTKDFMGLKLMNLATKNWHIFDLLFGVTVYTDGKQTQILSLSSRNASLRETPVPVGKTTALLRLKVRVNKPDLSHGQFDPKTGKSVNTSL